MTKHLSRAELQGEALSRATNGESFANYPAIMEGFAARGIALANDRIPHFTDRSGAIMRNRNGFYGDAAFANCKPRSALRGATYRNARNLPCPTCGEPDRLTPADKARGYQCDACANRDES